MSKCKVEATGLGIARSNQMFATLGDVGEVDEKGKTIFKASYRNKVTAQPDAPINTCILPMMIVLLGHVRHSSTEAAAKDLLCLQSYVASLSCGPLPEPKASTP